MAKLEDLIDVDDPGLTMLLEWAGQPSANSSVFLPPDQSLAGMTLLRLGITTRSILGAIVFETGGISVAGGLIRLWGSGTSRSLLLANRAASVAANRELTGILLIADDVYGGLFAINGGFFSKCNIGDIFHLPSDEAQWSCLDVGYSDFAAWCLGGDLTMLYGKNTQNLEIELSGKPAMDQVLATYPFPWNDEGRRASVSVREVNADEHLRLRVELNGFEIKV
ncbi:DUF2625 family protein (plasmid) [Agrobacterium sp. rho-13.3]|uniref:DUF2625 family protein n=1 Tax=Agrobacterium sp. rho-13.3 TaxID=3072980 RepID=UPI002A0E553A|nr:DUF2625 family protein [Agrobacterium sp. rho-13.3]MDX8310195.1 DUF2625 family protein [Agrobacterium sp. rho-13.3]